MKTVLTLPCLVLLVAACGPQESSTDATASTAAAVKSKAATALAGNYVVLASDACGFDFNNDNDPTQIAATSSELSISQDVDTPPGTAVFFQAKLGDVIQRPTKVLVSEGYTSVDRQIASYSKDGTSFEFNEYLYDMNLTDEEGLATGSIKRVQLSTEKGGVAYTLTYNDGEIYHCTFASSH